jgi:putative alpha-1,2-mannosidase
MKETEKASPGYYEVELYDQKVKVSLTATTRCSFQKYIYPECNESRVLIDLLFPTEWDYGFTVQDAKITKISNTEVEGYADCKSGAWSSWNDWKLFFVIRFSKPFEHFNGWDNDVIKKDVESIAGKGRIGAYVTFKTVEGDD